MKHEELRYNTLNPIVRVRESELIEEETWQRLLQAPDEEQVKQILATTAFGNYFSLSTPFDFEAMLKKRWSAFFKWAYEVAPEPELIDLYGLTYTFHNLKALTKGHLTGQDLEHLFIPDGRFKAEHLKSAIATQVSSSLPDYLVQAIQEVIHYFDDNKILQGIDVLYDRLYLTERKKIAENLGYPEVIVAIETAIDFSNILITLRSILQHQTTSFLSTMLSSSGSIPKEFYLPFVEQTSADFTTALLQTKYQEFLAKGLVGQTLTLKKLPFYMTHYLSTLYERGDLNAFGPLPLLNLMEKLVLEEKNLRLLWLAKSKHLPQNWLEERMLRNAL